MVSTPPPFDSPRCQHRSRESLVLLSRKKESTQLSYRTSRKPGRQPPAAGQAAAIAATAEAYQGAAARPPPPTAASLCLSTAEARRRRRCRLGSHLSAPLLCRALSACPGRTRAQSPCPAPPLQDRRARRGYTQRRCKVGDGDQHAAWGGEQQTPLCPRPSLSLCAPSVAEGGRCGSFRYSPVNSNCGHSVLLYSLGSTSVGSRGEG